MTGRLGIIDIHVVKRDITGVDGIMPLSKRHILTPASILIIQPTEAIYND